jgi:hypothetical protein
MFKKYTPLILGLLIGSQESRGQELNIKPQINPENIFEVVGSSYQLDNIEGWLEKFQDQVHNTDKYEQTPLHKASDLAVIRILVEHGAKIDALDEFGYTPLHSIASNWWLQGDVVDYLVQQGTNVNALTIDKTTPLHKACECGNFSIVKCLIKYNANVNAANKYGTTPLHLAARSGCVKIVDYLIQHGANVNAVDKYGKTPLSQAWSWPIVHKLVRHGAMDIRGICASHAMEMSLYIPKMALGLTLYKLHNIIHGNNNLKEDVLS